MPQTRPLAKIRNLAPDRGKGEGGKGKGTFMSAFFLFPTSARSLLYYWDLDKNCFSPFRDTFFYLYLPTS
jgi:hypothetical protein